MPSPTLISHLSGGRMPHIFPSRPRHWVDWWKLWMKIHRAIFIVPWREAWSRRLWAVAFVLWRVMQPRWKRVLPKRSEGARNMPPGHVDSHKPPLPLPPPQMQQKSLGLCACRQSVSCIYMRCGKLLGQKSKQNGTNRITLVKKMVTRLHTVDESNHPVIIRARTWSNQIQLQHRMHSIPKGPPYTGPREKSWLEVGVLVEMAAGVSVSICCRGPYIFTWVRHCTSKLYFTKAMDFSNPISNQCFPTSNQPNHT